MAIAAPQSQLLALYEEMLLIRVFETEAERQYKAARIGGYCHLSSGQEATCVEAVQRSWSEGDLLVTGYRVARLRARPRHRARGGHGRAVRPRDGCAHGRGGSMHLLDVDRGYYGGWGIVGGQLPLATGSRARARPPGAAARRPVRARRRRGEHRVLARVAQPRGAVAAADRLPRGQQPLRDGHLGGLVPRPSPSCIRASSAYRISSPETPPRGSCSAANGSPRTCDSTPTCAIARVSAS